MADGPPTVLLCKEQSRLQTTFGKQLGEPAIRRTGSDPTLITIGATLIGHWRQPIS